MIAEEFCMNRVREEWMRIASASLGFGRVRFMGAIVDWYVRAIPEELKGALLRTQRSYKGGLVSGVTWTGIKRY